MADAAALYVAGSVAHYVKAISAEWSSACSGMLKAIFRIGDELIEAKKELEHGEFATMELPFGVHSARQFMAIACQ